jgi:AAA15 family ATPase/GTPase
MRFYIKALQLSDFRNIKNNEILWLEEICSLVGQNESGKTSLLEAISQLDKFTLTQKDTTRGSLRYNQGKLPSLKFFLQPDAELVASIQENISNFTPKSMVSLTVGSGDKKNWEIKISTFNSGLNNFQERDFILKPAYKNVSGSPVNVTIDSNAVEVPVDGEIRFKGRNTQNMRLVRLGKLTKIPDSDLVEKIKSKILNNLPKVAWWPPRELVSEGIQKVYNEYYIPDNIVWADFIADPNKNPSVKRLFDLSVLSDASFADWSTVLKGFQDKNDARAIQTYWSKITKVIKSVLKDRWNQSDISIDFSFGTTSELCISISENGEQIEPSSRSEGFKWFFSFLLFFFTNRQVLKNLIILMDQPGEYIHPGGQKELRKRLEEIASESNQIIFSTQSPFLIDRNEWKKTKFLKKTSAWTTINTPTQKDVTYDLLLRESLGYTLADIGTANDYNLVVEGITDRILLNTVARIVKNNQVNKIGVTKSDFDLNKISIIEAKGIFYKENLFSKVQELRNSSLKACGVYDGDTTGNKALKDSRLDPTYGKYFTSTSILLPRSSVQTAEDLIPKFFYIKALKEIKNSLNTSQLENLSEYPRVSKLETEFGRNNIRDTKEKLWTAVDSQLTEIDINGPNYKELISAKETEYLLRIINKVYKELESER